MTVDLSKVVFHSNYQGFTIQDSGVVDHNATGSYTVNARTSHTVATGIDTTTQFVLAFATEERNDDTFPYDQAPVFYSITVDNGGIPTDTFVDILYYVENGNLIIEFFNFTDALAPGTYTITAGDEIRVAWFVFDMPAQS